MDDSAQNQNANLNPQTSVVSPPIPETPQVVADAANTAFPADDHTTMNNTFPPTESAENSPPPPPPPPVIDGNLSSSGPNPDSIPPSTVEPSFIPTYPKSGSNAKRWLGAVAGLMVLVLVMAVGVATVLKPKPTEKSKAATAAEMCPPAGCDTSQSCWVASTQNACFKNGQPEGSTETFWGNDNWDGNVCYTCDENSDEEGTERCSTGIYIGGNSDKCPGGPNPTQPPGGRTCQDPDVCPGNGSDGNPLTCKPTQDCAYDNGSGYWYCTGRAECKTDGTPKPTNSPTPTPGPTDTPTPGPTLPPEVGACEQVKIYDTSWNLLTAAQLKNLKTGDIIRVAASGTPAEKFDKARFIINGTTRAEVTQKKPNTNEYYDEYTILDGVTTFSISAQIHHLVLGWF